MRNAVNPCPQEIRNETRQVKNARSAAHTSGAFSIRTLHLRKWIDIMLSEKNRIHRTALQRCIHWGGAQIQVEWETDDLAHVSVVMYEPSPENIITVDFT